MRKYVMMMLLGAFCMSDPGRGLAASRRGDQGPMEAKTSPAAAETPSAAGVVNLNDAQPEQLELLPGVGPAKAKAIIDHRKTHPFKKIEELTKIKGIGRKIFARLRPYLAVSGPTTLTERPARPARSSSKSSS